MYKRGSQRRNNSALPYINLQNVEIINKSVIEVEEFLNEFKQTPLNLESKRIEEIGQHIFCFELQYSNQPQNKRDSKTEFNQQTWWIRKRVHDLENFRNEVGGKLMDKLNYYIHEKQIDQAKAHDDKNKLLDDYEEHLKNLLKQNDYDEDKQRKIRQFIELSYVNYYTQKKYKEAYFKKKAGGRYGESRCKRCGVFCGSWEQRLIIITNEAVMYAKNQDPDGAVIREVLTFDSKFQILNGHKETGEEFGIIIKTMTRVLQMSTKDLWTYVDFLGRLRDAISNSPYNQKYRFFSSAPVRKGKCRWFVSGAEYFDQIYEYLKKAKRTVYITDWWLSPEFYLRRPVGVERKNLLNRDSRLDLVLKDIADRGVQVYIIVYQEPTFALKIDSQHTQNHLESLSLNINVQRHPNQPPLPILWSHHEKMVVIDQKYAFMGGLDLCFGRMDTENHPLFDNDYETTLGTPKECEFWPGIDYSNSRQKDFFNVKVHHSTLLSNKRSCAKMPWQDIALFIQGEAVIDLARHFVQYWNFTTIDNNFDKRIGQDMLLVNQGPQLEQEQVPWTQKVKQFFSKVDPSNYRELDDKNEIKESQFLIKQYDANQIVQEIEDQIEAQQEEEEKQDQQQIKIEQSLSTLIVEEEEEKTQQNKLQTSQFMEMGQEQPSPKRKSKVFITNYDYCKKRNTDIMGSNKIIHSANFNSGRNTKFMPGSMMKINLRSSMINPPTESHPQISKGIRKEYLEIMKTAAQVKKNDIDQWIKEEKQNLKIQNEPIVQSNQRIFQDQYESGDQEQTQQQRRTAIRHNDVFLENFTPFLLNQSSNESYKTQSSIQQQLVNCQFLRSASKWSIGLQENSHENSIHLAYIDLISQAKNFIYIENQFFISSSAGRVVQNQVAKAIVTRIKEAAANKQKFKVVVFVPLLPGFEGEIDGPESAVLKVQLHWEYATISRGGSSILEVLKADPNIQNPSDYIQFFSLRQHQKDPLTGTPQTEIVYIHSKLMIIDDNIALIGSANINDRSLLGTRDSEIAMVIEDQETVLSLFDEIQSEHSQFAHTLRKKLYMSHFGLTAEEAEDPLNPELQLLINFRTKQNTQIYREIFQCYPDDNILSLQDYAQIKNKKNLDKYDELAPKIVGLCVEFPLRFLENENLKIKYTQKEFLCPEVNFT